MRIKLFLVDGGELEMDHMSAEDALDLRKEITEGIEDWITLDMDGGTVIVAKKHLVRVDFD